MVELADDRDFKVGIHDYHFHWSVNDGVPTIYTLSVSRNLPGSKQELLFTITIQTGKEHAMIDNRDYRESIADAMQKALEKYKPG